MEGPTPVSALIHAATMVTAGVYLIVRTHPLFEAAPKVQDLAAGLGAVTLVVAGLIALVQTDIKRVIAYSTMSQIGYMFLGVGLGAYADGMFHLMTHAFFKALLFLAAGIVIHALAGEQDIRKMGGLRRLMPFTYVAFLVGALALVGIPPFSGFFSKDSILAARSPRRRVRLRCSGRAGIDGRVPDRALHVPDDLPRLLRRARRPFVREHRCTDTSHEHDLRRRTAHDGRARSCVLGASPSRDDRRLDPVRRTSGRRSRTGSTRSPSRSSRRRGTQEAISSVARGRARPRRRSASPGGSTARAARRAPRCRWPALLEHKFWFDELYDALFYRPAVAARDGALRGRRAAARRAARSGSVVRGVAQTGPATAPRSRPASSAPTRSRSPASLAVLAVVFMAVR